MTTYAIEIDPAAANAPAVPKRKPPAMITRFAITNVVQFGSDANTSMPNETIAMSMTNIVRARRSSDTTKRGEWRKK